ncbi:PAS domain S-box protein [Emcibacter sp. SYSU 3D8]|uniref:hybrid sensor histidine kinase/response regulator n=1 Tax=Emcibacter sp. SYSU 3D8 TaxID=3133969 RepID=UPI0031FE4A3F
MGLADSKYVDPGALERLISGDAGDDFVRLLFEYAPSAIAVFDRDMRYLAASRRWYEDYELGDQQILGQCHYDVFPDVPDRWRDEHAKCLAGEARRCEQDRFDRSDGTTVYIRWELVPMGDGSAPPRGMVMMTEVITRRVEAEAAKQATEKTREIAEQIAHVGTWDWDLLTDKVHCSPEMCRLLGMGDNAITIGIDDLIAPVHPADVADMTARIARVRSGLDPRPELTTRVIRPDGTTVWLRLAVRASRDSGGKPVLVHGTIQDITDQRMAQRELAIRDRAFETAASPLTLSTLDARYTYGNKAFVALLGYSSFDDIDGRPFRDFITDPDKVAGSIETLRETGRWAGELRMVRADGTEFDVAVLAGVVLDDEGEPFRVIVSYLDITERNKALAVLSRREGQLRQAQKLARVGAWRLDIAGGIYQMPAETRNILGLDGGYAAYDQALAERQIHPDDFPQFEAAIQELESGAIDSARVQYRFLTPHGETIHLQVILEAERDASGTLTGLSGVLQDVTGFRQLEQAHRETERAMTALMRNLSGMVYRCENDERWTMRFVSDACRQVLGYEGHELIDNQLISYMEVLDPRDRQRVWDGIQSAIKNRHAFQMSYRITTKQGELRWVLEQGSAIRDEHDNVVALEGYVADITAEQRVVEQLQESEARNRAIMESASVALITANDQGMIESANPEAERLFGYPAAEIAGRDLAVLMPAFHAAPAEGGAPREVTGVRRGGEEFPVDLAVSDMRLGDRRLIIASARDLTERKRAEARLNQAQKMETVGQLVGGVAHDFNNLLMAMQLNLELATMLVDDRPEVAESINVALSAVDRGAELTRRLLAFSRQQPLEPRVINANELIGNMMKLLHRLLQENIDTQTHLDPAIWPMEVDPGQLEAALLNLIVNARDAMPDGGSLRIETANVVLEPADAEHPDDVAQGEHVRITVSDTGTGMPPDVQERAFDPFFTTKDVGKGSGLGLSMVYGFVKQSGGHIAIDSSVGVGTRIVLHFRRAHAAPVSSMARKPEQETIRPGHETILLVEDDADVRQTIDRLLKSLGYQVTAAADGPAAVELIVGGLRPDLLLADVVLPKGMGGMDVAEAVAARVPTCRILFMSGYTEDAVTHHGRLDEGVVLLSKPFPRDLLASKVRELLDD